jgi:hypothetical protein
VLVTNAETNPLRFQPLLTLGRGVPRPLSDNGVQLGRPRRFSPMRPLALRFYLPSIFIEKAAIHVLNPSIFARGPELVEVPDGKLPVLTQIDVDYSVTITNLYDQCHRSILSANIITAK